MRIEDLTEEEIMQWGSTEEGSNIDLFLHKTRGRLASAKMNHDLIKVGRARKNSKENIIGAYEDFQLNMELFSEGKQPYPGELPRHLFEEIYKKSEFDWTDYRKFMKFFKWFNGTYNFLTILKYSLE